MKKILFLVILQLSILSAYSNVTKIVGDGSITWYFTCDNGKRGVVNYYYNMKQYYSSTQGIYPYYNTMSSAALAECKILSSKKSKKNYTYGYVKKGAIIFSKKTGDNSIEWALSYSDPKRHNLGNNMKNFGELQVMFGNLPTNRKRTKVILLKKYDKKNLSNGYWKIKDGTKVKYISSKDIER